MPPEDKDFHSSFKPKWTKNGCLLSRANFTSSNSPWTWEDSQVFGELTLGQLRGDGQDVRQYLLP